MSIQKKKNALSGMIFFCLFCLGTLVLFLALQAFHWDITNRYWSATSLSPHG